MRIYNEAESWLLILKHGNSLHLTEAISKTLGDTYQRLYELPDPKLPVKYPRTPGYRPSAEENPYNAWWETAVYQTDKNLSLRLRVNELRLCA